MASSDDQVMPPLTDSTPRREQLEGQATVTNGNAANLRKTHPNLWRAVMAFAAVNALLGLNFLILQPTFLIYNRSNYWWGAIFLTLAACKIVFLNLYRNLHLLRVTMACEVSFMMVIALGTTQPFFEGEGSLQLPILYLGMCVLEMPLLLEPFINPWTARRD